VPTLKKQCDKSFLLTCPLVPLFQHTYLQGNEQIKGFQNTVFLLTPGKYRSISHSGATGTPSKPKLANLSMLDLNK